MLLADGLEYSSFVYRESTVHWLSIDLNKREVRPVLAADHFPFLRIYPIKNAIAQGALASVGGGFNTTWFHHQGVADQPLHALVVDGEIWTTGTGAGGIGCIISSQGVWIETNHIRARIWRPDALWIEHINHRHDGSVVGFTYRGGTNEYPMEGKYYTALLANGPLTTGLSSNRVKMTVTAVSEFKSLQPVMAPLQLILESRWPIRHLKVGDTVIYTQDIAAVYDVRHVVSGWPWIIEDGHNEVPALDLHGVASNGPDNWFIRKNPRMALGVSEDHMTMYMCVVEGRIPNSVGLRLKELATMMLHRGVWNAVNMDGGGSAFMWTLPGGLVAPGCYNTTRTIDGLRPDHYATAVF